MPVKIIQFVFVPRSNISIIYLIRAVFIVAVHNGGKLFVKGSHLLLKAIVDPALIGRNTIHQ